jgi:hypothetical protein
MVIFQKPNKPLIVALSAVLLTHLLHGNDWLHATLHAISTVAFVYWAYLEITFGVSLFRRLLGWLVMLLTIHAAIQYFLY